MLCDRAEPGNPCPTRLSWVISTKISSFYTARIIKNLFIDEKRKERVQREFSIAQNRLSDIGRARTGDPVEALMVRQAYAKLAPREREILCLVDILGLTYAETAAIIDVPVGTVMSRVSRARSAMIERMGETNVRPLKKRKG